MRGLLSLMLAAACVVVPFAQQDVAQTPAIVITHHQVTIGTNVLRYTGLAMGQAAPDAIRTALFVPARTATAFYHGALAPALMRDEQMTSKEAETWALAEYAPAWEKRDSLTDQDRDRIIRDLAKYTGVPASSIDRATLSMTSPQFTAALLKDRGVTLGRYDMRVLGAHDVRHESCADPLAR